MEHALPILSDSGTRAFSPIRIKADSSALLAQSVVRKALLDSGPGIPLPYNVRVVLESYFKADLSTIAIHASNLPLFFGAKGFACGERIYLLPDLCNFRDEKVMALLLHEITHTLQQRRGVAASDELAILSDPDLEDEARRNEADSSEIIGRIEHGETGLAQSFPKDLPDRASVGNVIQLSQGWETELGCVVLVKGNRHRGGKAIAYDTELIKTSNRGSKKYNNSGLFDEMPGFTVAVDHQTHNGEYIAIPEVVTDPIMIRKVRNSTEFRYLTRDCKFFMWWLYDFICDKNRDYKKGKAGRYVSLESFVNYYNSDEKRENRTFKKFIRKLRLRTGGQNIFIDIETTMKRLKATGKSGKRRMRAMNQYSFTVPIDRIYTEEQRDRLTEIFSNNAYASSPCQVGCWEESVAAGNSVVEKIFGDVLDSREEEDALYERDRGLKKLRGLMILTCYIVKTMCTSYRKLKAGGIYKNKFGLLPKNPLPDMIRLALSDRAQATLVNITKKRSRRNKLFDAISKYTGIKRGKAYNVGGGYDDTLTLEEIVEEAFKPETRSHRGIFKRHYTGEYEREASDGWKLIVSKIIELTIHEDEVEKDENDYLKRNIVFETRLNPMYITFGEESYIEGLQRMAERCDALYN